jgi:hypothetical protein
MNNGNNGNGSNGNGSNGLREKVKFLPNVPVELALKYATGKAITTDYGDSVMYSLTDGRVMFLKPDEAARLHAANIPAGEVFALCRTVRIEGNHKFTSLEICGLGQAAPQGPQSVPPPPPRVMSPLEASLRASLRERGIEPTEPVNETRPATVEPPQAPARAAFTAQVATNNTIHTTLTASLHAAIDAAAAAESYAKSIDYAVRFTSEDVRAIALTMLIGAQRGGR